MSEVIDDDAVAQARAAWALAISLLVRSGMSDPAARKRFGGILSKHKLNARALLQALQAAEASGTLDAGPWIEKAAQRAAAGSGDPALKCAWG